MTNEECEFCELELVLCQMDDCRADEVLKRWVDADG